MAKKIIAVDIDDVLADSTDALRRVVNERLGVDLQPEDYHIKNEDYWGHYKIVWKRHGLEGKIKLSDIEPMMIVNQSHVMPHEGAFRALKKLGGQYELVIVTSRPVSWRVATEEWLDMHFPGIFRTILFTRATLDGEHADKGQICVENGVSWLIDDNVDHAKSALDQGVGIIVFGDYGWHHKVPSHFVRCKTWAEVLEFFDEEG